MPSVAYDVSGTVPGGARLAWLAERVRVGLSTVKDFERGDRKPIANNLDAMRRAIEAAGIDLIEEDGKAVGIRAT
jgi:hypothetical protein